MHLKTILLQPWFNPLLQRVRHRERGLQPEIHGRHFDHNRRDQQRRSLCVDERRLQLVSIPRGLYVQWY